MSSGSPGSPRRVLVVANETLAGAGVVEEVRYRAGAGGDVVVVAPELARSRMDHWLASDSEARHAAAEERLARTLAALKDAGLTAKGALGDPDPLQALDDALRTYDPDEVVISTHPPARSNWLERKVVGRARERYALPITHLVVDLEHERAAARADAAPREETGPGDREGRLRVYHASPYEEALLIREGGFRDRSAWAADVGVWVSDRPPAAGADSVLFAVDLPDGRIASYERGTGEDGERRFLVPAEILNRFGPPVAVDDWSE
jgi:hypothetical protein